MTLTMVIIYLRELVLVYHSGVSPLYLSDTSRNDIVIIKIIIINMYSMMWDVLRENLYILCQYFKLYNLFPGVGYYLINSHKYIPFHTR